MRHSLLALLLVGSPIYGQQVYFSPGGECSAAVVRALAGAKQSVHLQAYGFTAPKIGAALVAAHRRGVKVELVLDRSARTAHRCQAPEMRAAGIPILFDGKHPIAHAKVIIIDGTKVLAGSYNWTLQAEENSEDLIETDGAEIARKFEANYQLHKAHSETSLSAAPKPRAVSRRILSRGPRRWSSQSASISSDIGRLPGGDPHGTIYRARRQRPGHQFEKSHPGGSPSPAPQGGGPGEARH